MTSAATSSVPLLLKRVAALDRERRMLISQLLDHGFRTRGLVGEYGELISAAYYRVKLEPPSGDW